MRKVKELEINYRAYTFLLFKQKLPFFILGFCLVFLIFFIVSHKFIISGFFKKENKTTKINQKPVKKYIVEEGEDLWQIAEKNYGSGFNAFDIAQSNNLKEPYILQKGQVLIIPSVAKRSPTKGDITEPAPSTTQVTLMGSTYIVQDGDYLFQIAQKAYGDGNMMQKIIDANKIPYPYNVEVGQNLLIPR